MFESANDLLLVFSQAQGRQAAKWLLNYQLYLVVLGLVVLSLLFPVYRWTRQSTVSLVQDYFYGIFHTLVSLPALAVCSVLLSQSLGPSLPSLGLASNLPPFVQVLVAILVNDFVKYLAHYLHHRIRPLWYFHTIHHSQEHLNPFTTKRTHVVENLFDMVFIGWIPLAIMGSSPQVWAAYFLFSVVWDYFIHSNLRISLGPLKYVLVSPLYHRLHHSSERRHFNKNYCDRLVLWDVVFGTADFNVEDACSTGVPDAGIAHEREWRPSDVLRTFWHQWIYPFRRLSRQANAILARLAASRSRRSTWVDEEASRTKTKKGLRFLAGPFA